MERSHYIEYMDLIISLGELFLQVQLRDILSGNDKRAEIIENVFKGCDNAAKAIVDRVLGVRQ